MREVRVDSISERMLWMSVRTLIRASTSSIARGTTVPVIAGRMVRMVLFRLTAMLTKEASMVGATAVVVSDATEEARGLRC